MDIEPLLPDADRNDLRPSASSRSSAASNATGGRSPTSEGRAVTQQATATPTALDEGTLLAGLKARDPSAFETFVRSQSGRMLAVARRFLGNEADAQDAVQDAFLNAFRAIGGFQGDSRLSTWLHRIVVNAALMKVRTRSRRGEEPIDPFLPVFREGGVPEHPTSEWKHTGIDALARQESRQFVRQAIDRLPTSYRNVLVLRDIEGFDTAETSRLLDLTPSAVKIRLHRARQALRALLEPHFREAKS
jgi:RNA polymerase sigma-70 factor (ECF subfamily)